MTDPEPKCEHGQTGPHLQMLIDYHPTEGAGTRVVECPGPAAAVPKKVDSDTLSVPYVECPSCGATIRARMAPRAAAVPTPEEGADDA